MYEQLQALLAVAIISLLLPSTIRGTEGVDPIFLHIGGEVRKPGWTVLNSQMTPATDILGTMDNLTMFADSSVMAIYASHVLEHAPHNPQRNASTPSILKEWHRVLLNGGLALIGVPDMIALSELLVTKQQSLEESSLLAAVLFGGQINDYDYHMAGFSEVILTKLLNDAGFCKVERVDLFHLFNNPRDCTYANIFDRCVSLNVIATACKEGPLYDVKLLNS